MEKDGMPTLPGGVVNQFSPEMLSVALKAAEKLAGGRRVAELGRTFGSDQHGWKNLNDFKRQYFETNPRTVFENCRKLRKQHGWLDAFLRLRASFVLDGFRFASDGGRLLEADNPGYDFKRLLEDAAIEIGTCGNAVAQWATGPAGKRDAGLPRPVILNCEQVEYKDEDGIERVKPDKDAAKEPLTGRQATGTRSVSVGTGKDEWIVLGEESGERFEVYSSGKRGGGYGVPAIYGLIFDVGMIEVLQTGDFNAALMKRDVMRQIKKGHSIPSGPMAGQPVYFLKRGDIKAIKDALEKKMGAFDFITNFDVEIEFPTMDNKHFGKEKYEAVWSRVLDWMGPLGRYLTASNGEAAAAALSAFRTECADERDRLRRFVLRIFNHTDFHGQAKLAGQIDIGFNPFTCYSTRERREMMSWALANGLMSPQTATELMGLESGREHARLAEAAANPEAYRPVFEPKQGLLLADMNTQTGAGDGGDGGRPTGTTNREVEE